MGRICKICWSPHRPEYDKKLLEGWEIKEVWRYAITKYNERFSYESLRRHAKNHVEELVRTQVEASKLRQKRIDEEIQKSIEISEQLRRNLQLCNDQIQELSKDVSDPNRRREIRDVIGKINQTVELLLRFSDKLTKSESRMDPEEVLIDRLRYALQDIPWEYASKILERFKQYEQIREYKQINEIR